MQKGMMGLAGNPPHRAKDIVNMVVARRNAKSCIGSIIEQQNTKVEPARPVVINPARIVRTTRLRSLRQIIFCPQQKLESQ